MKKSYSELLKHPKWQKKRLEILNRDGFSCMDCGDSESTLHVHHIKYIYGNDIWDYNDSNFVTLCESCHNDITKMKKYIKSTIDDTFISLDEILEFTKIIDLLKQSYIYDLVEIRKSINNYFIKNKL